MTWRFLKFAEAKSHAVPDALVDTVVGDLAGRGHPLTGSEPLDAYRFDPGGAYIEEHPSLKLPIDGLTVHVLAGDVGILLGDLKAAKRRGKPKSPQRHYKVHGQWTAMVLTPAARTQLLTLLRAAEEGAEAQADAFYEAWGKKHEKRSG